MTREEHLTARLGEECCEVAVRCNKANNFGPDEVYPGQTREPKENNAEMIRRELLEAMAVYLMLETEFGFPTLGVALLNLAPFSRMVVRDKQEKVETYFKFAAARGRIDGIPANPHEPHPDHPQRHQWETVEAPEPIPCTAGRAPHVWNEFTRGCVACGIRKDAFLTGGK